MLLTLSNVLLIIAQVTQSNDTSQPNLWNYGLAGGLIVLLIILIKVGYKIVKNDNEKREEKIMEFNKARENKLAEALTDLKNFLRDTNRNYDNTLDRMDKGYKDAIDRFVKVVEKMMDQNSYTISVLTELKDKVEEAARRNNFDELKRDILAILQKMGLEYNLSKKEHS